VSSDVEKCDELQSLFSNMNQQGQGDGTRTCINEVMDKICDLSKCTASECSLLKIEIQPVINLINLGSINCALKSVRNFTLQIIDIILLKIDIDLLKIDIVLLKIDIVLLNGKKTLML
jgi:hypothetical protein